MLTALRSFLSMKISDFWNQAFISCLGRLPAQEARAEADKALEIALEHWQAVMTSPLNPKNRM